MQMKIIHSISFKRRKIPVFPIVFSEDVKKRVFLRIEKVISLNFIILCLAKQILLIRRWYIFAVIREREAHSSQQTPIWYPTQNDLLALFGTLGPVPVYPKLFECVLIV